MHATNRPLVSERLGAGRSKWQSWLSALNVLLTMLGCLQGAATYPWPH